MSSSSSSVLSLSRRHQDLFQTQLEEVICALGLDKSGHMTTEVLNDQFVKGIRTLCDVHFSNHHESQRADIVGGLLFQNRIFSKEASLGTTAKATASMASCIFNAVNILKMIYSKAGSLYDTAVDEYAKIELDSELT